jgi:hypothetical protein
MYNFSLDEKRPLYIRIPQKLSEFEYKKLMLELTGKLEGKTLKIEVLDSDDASIPFRRDVIKQSIENADMAYYGSNFYWEPDCVPSGKVHDHLECDFPCDPDCKAVTCPVYQGFEEEKPDKYFCSKRMTEDD